MDTTIHVVFGSTGEYSDRSEWPVKAFRTEATAQELVLAATKSANEVFAARKRKYSYNVPKGANPHDPHMEMDYTGTRYYVVTVALEDR